MESPGRDYSKSGYPELVIGIASTFDIWCAGMEPLIHQWGWRFAGRWRSSDEAFAQRANLPDSADFDLAIISSCKDVNISLATPDPDAIGLTLTAGVYSGRMPMLGGRGTRHGVGELTRW